MKVGFLGTGLMGLPMAQSLLAANFELVAYNRTPEKLAPLREVGATIASTPEQAIAIAKAVRTQSLKRIPLRPADNQIVLIACRFDF